MSFITSILSEPHLQGAVAAPVIWYIVKNNYLYIWSDLKALWAKYVTKTPTP